MFCFYVTLFVVAILCKGDLLARSQQGRAHGCATTNSYSIKKPVAANVQPLPQHLIQGGGPKPEKVKSKSAIVKSHNVPFFVKLLEDVLKKCNLKVISISTVGQFAVKEEIPPPTQAPKGSKSQVEINKQTALWAIPTDPWG